MYRNERLQVIEEEPYKKGGKVRKGKKKARKGTAKARKSRKATTTRGQRRKAEAMRYLPGAPSAMTGMGSVVFGAPQAPSYFRAVAPEQQTFATLPGSLKALQEGQEKLFKELEKQKEQLRKDAKMARDMAEAEAKQETTSKYVSPMSSRSLTPITSYTRPASPAVSSTAVVPPPIQTLTPLERQRSMTTEIMTTAMMPSIPTTAVQVEPTWQVSTSSREAGYMGADETLPVQAPASGANMVPEDVVYDSAPDSAFIPISASAPESVGDAVERAAQVATSASSHAPSRSLSTPLTTWRVPGSNQLVMSRRLRKEDIVFSPSPPSRPRSASPKAKKKFSERAIRKEAKEMIKKDIAEELAKQKAEKQASAPQSPPRQEPRKVSRYTMATAQEYLAKRRAEKGLSQSGAV